MYAVLPMIVPGLAVYSSWVLTGIMLAGTLVMGECRLHVSMKTTSLSGSCYNNFCYVCSLHQAETKKD